MMDIILSAKIYWISNDMLKIRAFEKHADKYSQQMTLAVPDCDARTEHACWEGRPYPCHLLSFPQPSLPRW